jgi:hypothetical protein
LGTLGLQPHTWDGLKIAMRQRFVPPSYQRDLRKKLIRLDQGDKSVQDYYAELQKGIIHAGVHEETEDKIYHFYGGLRAEIQDIVDYKEYNTVNHLFQLTMLAEKELQGRQPTRLKSSFTSRHTSMTPSTSRAPVTARFPMTPSTSRAPSTSTTPPPAPCASETTPPPPRAAAKLSSSSTTSTDRTSDIKCHHCHGVGHFQHDCPSKKSYITTDDGGYVSASDVEDDFALETNNTCGIDDDDAEVFGSEHTEEYSTKTYVVQRVLSAQVDTSEKVQRHNLFQIFFIVKDCRVHTIIDGGSCNKLVSVDFMVKIVLTTRLHTHPYYIQWLNNSGKTKVIHTTHVHFSIGTYHDYADCDVVPMQTYSLLLDHPWEFDTDAIHYDRSNKYTLVHNGKKITLFPLTPNEIVQCDRAIAKTARQESKIQHASPVKLEQRLSSLSSNAIKLKSHAMLATKSDIAVFTNVDVSFYTLVCRQVLFSLEDITTPLPRAITNLL